MRQTLREKKMLTELLRQVALVNRDSELRDFMEVYSAVLQTSRHEPIAAGRGEKVFIPEPPPEEDLAKALDICLRGHDELRDYINSRKEAPAPDRLLGQPWQWYMFIRSAREKLLRFTQHLPVEGIYIDSEGVIQTSRDLFKEAVDGLPAHLLRECGNEKCRRIFLAKRDRQPGCTERCSTAIRVRAKRKRDKEILERWILPATAPSVPTQSEIDNVRGIRDRLCKLLRMKEFQHTRENVEMIVEETGYPAAKVRLILNQLDSQASDKQKRAKTARKR